MQATIVATDLGSLPDGGFEDETPIYQASEHALKKSTQALRVIKI